MSATIIPCRSESRTATAVVSTMKKNPAAGEINS
jgi:hypothetical protein